MLTLGLQGLTLNLFSGRSCSSRTCLNCLNQWTRSRATISSSLVAFHPWLLKIWFAFKWKAWNPVASQRLWTTHPPPWLVARGSPKLFPKRFGKGVVFYFPIASVIGKSVDQPLFLTWNFQKMTINLKELSKQLKHSPKTVSRALGLVEVPIGLVFYTNQLQRKAAGALNVRCIPFI